MIGTSSDHVVRLKCQLGDSRFEGTQPSWEDTQAIRGIEFSNDIVEIIPSNMTASLVQLSCRTATLVESSCDNFRQIPTALLNITIRKGKIQTLQFDSCISNLNCQFGAF